jgi:hypothetical protein
LEVPENPRRFCDTSIPQAGFFSVRQVRQSCISLQKGCNLSELRDFLELSYGELEDLNLQAKEQRKKRVAADVIQEERLKYLTDERRIKAVTVLFSDLEGRLHMLDYDKKFLVKSYDNLTFVDSRIHGAAGERSAAGDRLERVLLGAGGCVWRG